MAQNQRQRPYPQIALNIRPAPVSGPGARAVGDAGPYTGFCGNQRSRRGRQPLQARRKSAEKGKSANLRGRHSGRPHRAAPAIAPKNMVVGAHHDAPAKNSRPPSRRISSPQGISSSKMISPVRRTDFIEKAPRRVLFLWFMASGCGVFPLSIECFSG